MRIDLNADIGEGVSSPAGAGDAELLRIVSSASIACGGHAGDAGSMHRAIVLAQAAGVSIGAHPSYPDREGFGRQVMALSLQDLRASLREQIDACRGAATRVGAVVRHVKPHGALYNVAADDATVADVIIDAVRDVDAGLALMALAGSVLAERATRAGLTVWREGFADRGYTAQGRLMSRGRPGAVRHAEADVVAQGLSLATEGRVRTADGGELAIAVDSICVHGDTPGAVGLATALRRALEERGVRVAACGGA